jgi:hypothetical protein
MSTLKLDTIQHPDAAGAALTFDSDGSVTSSGTLNLENIKHPNSASNNISVDSSGNVGLGGPSTSSYLQGVVGGKAVTIGSSSEASSTLVLKDDDGVFDLAITGGTFRVYDDGLERMRIDTAGRVTMPYQPMFCAYPNGTNGFSDSPLKYDATIANVGNHYNTSNYRFTAPIAGTYYFSYSIWTGSGTTTRCAFYKNGTGVGNATYPIGTRNEASSGENDSGSLIITLAQNDYIDIRVYAGAVGIFGTNYFIGYLIG